MSFSTWAEVGGRSRRLYRLTRQGRAELKRRRFFSAPIPASLGGGDASYGDVCAIVRTLAHGCSATALAVAMHMHPLALTIRRWRDEQARAESREGIWYFLKNCLKGHLRRTGRTLRILDRLRGGLLAHHALDGRVVAGAGLAGRRSHVIASGDPETENDGDFATSGYLSQATLSNDLTSVSWNTDGLPKLVFDGLPVNYVDHGGFDGVRPYHVRSSEITGYLIDPAFPNARDICGWGRVTVNGGEFITRFRVRMVDNGEPGGFLNKIVLRDGTAFDTRPRSRARG